MQDEADRPRKRHPFTQAERTPITELMTREVVTVSADLSLDSVVDVLLERGLSRLPVVDETGKAIGILSRSDVPFDQHMGADAGGTLVGDVMTERVVTLPESTTVGQAATLMAKHHLHGVPVVSTADQVVGMLSASDIAAWVAGMLPADGEPEPEASREFADRTQAGRRLGGQLAHHAGQDPLVLGLSRGGVAVAFEVAVILDAPLEAWLARKGRAAPDVRGRTVILVDDAIVTGCTARTALQAMRAGGARRVALAVPLAAMRVIADLRLLADEVVCLAHPRELVAIAAWYDDFGPVSEAEMVGLVERRRLRRAR